MKINKYKNIIKNQKKIQETKLHSIPFHSIPYFLAGSFAVLIADHLRFGIICGPIWGSIPVSGSFAIWDHLRRCTVDEKLIGGNQSFGLNNTMRENLQG